MLRVLVGVLVVVSGCRNGSAVDLQLLATPTMALNGLTVELLLSRTPDGGDRHETFTWADGGVVLPTSLRLLVDAQRADVHVFGFDADGGAHQATTGANLKPGSATTLSLDLSKAGVCPAAAARADEVVYFDDASAPDLAVFGFRNERLTPTRLTPDACSGSAVIEYTADTQFVDGFGVYTGDRKVRYRHVSLRMWASRSSTWIIALGDPAAGLDGIVLPDPVNCSPGHPQPCFITLGPEWQRFEFDIPASAPAATQIFVQFQDVTSANAVVARMDDIRVVY